MYEIALYHRYVHGPVRLQRVTGSDRILLLSGTTSSYRVEPRGEYIFGVVGGQAMSSRRGGERRTASPGQLVAWDPSAAHSGNSASGQPWTSRLLVVEIPDLTHLAVDPDADPLGDVAFPQPVITDPGLAKAFLRLHATLATTSTSLEADTRLTEWLRLLIERWSAYRRPQVEGWSPHEERAFRSAVAMLRDRATEPVRLDELASASGMGKFRLIRLFRERTGLPPHALQIAHRIRLARRLLEAGEMVVDTAAATGFTDQSHLHRQFRRTLGMTPASYQRRIRAGRLG